MSKEDVQGKVLCANCGYFHKSALSVKKSLALRSCRFFGHSTHSDSICSAYDKTDAELPHCEECGKTVWPFASWELSSRFCPECWQIGVRKKEEENLQWENKYQIIAEEIAASENGGIPARSVVWCTWGITAYVQKTGEGHAATIVGGLLLGGAGAGIGGMIDSARADTITTYTGSVGLLIATDTDLVLAILADSINFYTSTHLRLGLIKDYSHNNYILSSRKCIRFPLSEIHPICTDNRILFSHGQRPFQFNIPDIPEIPHQVSAPKLLLTIREAGALPPVMEYLSTMLSGSPDFCDKSWHPITQNEVYWCNLRDRVRQEQLDSDRVYRFLREFALVISQPQADAKYIEFLWILFLTMSSNQQKELVRHWLDNGLNPKSASLSARSIYEAFLEKVRSEMGRAGWLTGRKFKKIEAILTEVSSYGIDSQSFLAV
jgi:hypothetical protein